MSKKVGVTFRFQKKVEPYVRALTSVGLEPVLISPEEPKSLGGLGGLVLTGGSDVSPSHYGQNQQPETDEPDEARDELESRLLQEALALDLPVLAICRGMQLFNVVHGGTLIQHLENTATHQVVSADSAGSVHQIAVVPGTALAAILGEGRHPVNSRHHQAVGVLGAGLTVSARSADDGVIEGLERSDKRFAVGVQWHPEDQVNADKTQKKLFEAFASATLYGSAARDNYRNRSL